MTPAAKTLFALGAALVLTGLIIANRHESQAATAIIVGAMVMVIAVWAEVLA